MERNKVEKCIVISDSCDNSAIGFMDECIELFIHTDIVFVVGGISPFYNIENQLLQANTS